MAFLRSGFVLHFHHKIPGLFKYFLSTTNCYFQGLFLKMFLMFTNDSSAIFKNSHILIQKLKSIMSISSDSSSFPRVLAILPFLRAFQVPLKTSFQFQDFSRISRSSANPVRYTRRISANKNCQFF